MLLLLLQHQQRLMESLFSCLGCIATDGNKLLDAAAEGNAEAAVDVLRRKPAKAWTAQQWGE